MRAQLLKEFPDLPRESVLRANDFNRAAVEIGQKYKGNKVIEQALNKMGLRKGVVDKDLCGVMPAGLLVIVWFDFIKVHNAFDHMQLLLEDIASHCIQGDSHRLFATYVAYARVTPKWAETALLS
jgi:hypothetical protein